MYFNNSRPGTSFRAVIEKDIPGIFYDDGYCGNIILNSDSKGSGFKCMNLRGETIIDFSFWKDNDTSAISDKFIGTLEGLERRDFTSSCDRDIYCFEKIRVTGFLSNEAFPINEKGAGHK